VLLLDVDGPLNPYAAKPHRRPEGYETHRLLTPRWETAERRRLTEWGLPNKPVKPLRVWLNPNHGPALAALPFDLVWATTCEEDRAEPGGGVFWKTPEIVAWAKGRAFAWIDDEITEADRAWVNEHHEGPALLHRVDPRFGLANNDFAALTAWATGLD
jgi:hypothetical protein